MKKPTRAAAVVSTALLAGILSGATPSAPSVQPPGPQKTTPTVARGHEHDAFVDDELMVSDPENPRLLHSKRPGVIDRKWIERTAMPRIPKDVLDDLARSVPARPGDRVLRSPEAPGLVGAAFAPRIDGNVLIVDGAGLTGNDRNGNLAFDHNNASFDIINLVLSNLGDNYDFVSVFTTFDDASVAAYYFPLKQDIDGLGACDFDNGNTFGCLFDQTGGQLEHLQGFVFMNSLNTWRDSDFNYDGVAHSFDDFESSVFSTLGQEVAHRWGSGLRFIDPRSDRVSNLLLGRDNSHWAAYADTDASVMDGWDWTAEDSGEFKLVGDMERYSTLDLYTMGALPVAAAEPFFVIDDAVFDVSGDQIGIDNRAIPADVVLQLPSVALMDRIGMKVQATGEKVPVTIQSVVYAEGNRCPDPGATQKTFRQAVVLVTRPGQQPSQADVDDLNLVLATWEAWWLDRTNKTLELCTSLDGDACTHAELEITGGELSHDGDSIQPGEAGTLALTIKASGKKVEGAVVTFEAIGDSAEFTDVEGFVDVGDIDEGDEKTVEVKVEYDGKYPCGFSSIIRATVSADNAADVVEEVRTFPGMKVLEEETFAGEDHPYGVNADEKDGTTAATEGALRYTGNVELTCDMTQRSVERDASPGDRGAFVTGPGTDHVPNLIDHDAGEGAELDGDTTLWSPSFDLTGARDPEFRFAYWFDGEEGDSLKVQLSGDGEKTFKTGKEETESFHGWVVGRVSGRDVFVDGALPP
jgi:hypothetical protein